MGKVSNNQATENDRGFFEHIVRRFTGFRYMCEFNVRVVTDTNYISEYTLHLNDLSNAIDRVNLLEYGTKHITISDEDGNLLAEKVIDKNWVVLDKRK